MNEKGLDAEKLKKVEHFIIKPDVELRFSKDGRYLEIDYDKMFAKKITSTKFPALLGKNNFAGKGYQYMELLNLTERGYFNQYYMYRGELAERLAYEMLKEMFEKRFGSVMCEVMLFDNNQFTYGDQWHYNKDTKKGNKYFGGRIDIGVKVELPQKEIKRFVAEVKGKSMKSYDYIVGKDNYPENEVWQGKFLATLTRLDEIQMVYVFFTEEQEDKLKAWFENDTKEFADKWTYKDVKINLKQFKFDKEEFARDMNITSSNLRSMAKEKRIPLHFFNDDELYKIGIFIQEQEQKRLKNKEFEEKAQKNVEKTDWGGVDQDDLPF